MYDDRVSFRNDSIAPEMLKVREYGRSELVDICNYGRTTEQVLKDFEVRVMLAVFKKGDVINCNNHRGIMLLTVALKVYETI